MFFAAAAALLFQEDNHSLAEASYNQSSLSPEPCPPGDDVCFKAWLAANPTIPAPNPSIRNLRPRGSSPPPQAKCQAVAKESCSGLVSVSANEFDGGSADPNVGYTLSFATSPPGPYNLGVTDVTLTVSGNGASDTCTTTVTVGDTTVGTTFVSNFFV